VKITFALDPISGRGTLITFSPLFTFLSVISFISDIFDHYYATFQTPTRTWPPFKKLLLFSPHPCSITPTSIPLCLYYKKRNWLSKPTHVYLRGKKTYFISPTDESAIILPAGGGGCSHDEFNHSNLPGLHLRPLASAWTPISPTR
jgi:hypothetical protein